MDFVDRTPRGGLTRWDNPVPMPCSTCGAPAAFVEVGPDRETVRGFRCAADHGAQPAPDAPATVLINGVRYDVLSEQDGKLRVRRPNGSKVYPARRLPDSPIYGANRGVMVPEVAS